MSTQINKIMKRIGIYYNCKSQHQIRYASQMAIGMKKLGCRVDVIPKDSTAVNVEKYDCIAFWAHKERRLMELARQAKVPYLVMERAYLGDRHNWLSLGFNGLNGRARFNNKHITSTERFNKYWKMKDWKVKESGYVLVIGQVAGDASHSHVSIGDWYINTISNLVRLGHNVVFRPHPLDKNNSLHCIRGLACNIDQCKNLEDHFTDESNCKAVVTFNSNSGVLSVMNGIPTFSQDCGSMVYSVASHDLNKLIQTPCRNDWAAKIAYTQWLPEELESGEFWEHLTSTNTTDCFSKY